MPTEIDRDDKAYQVQVDDMLESVSCMIEKLDSAQIKSIADLMVEADIVVGFGNGGSHVVASHFAGDIMLRPGPLFIAIGDNIVSHTAYANDYSFEESAALEVKRINDAHIGKKKMLIVFSTSGESKNIMRAAKMAKELKWTVVAMLGRHLHRLEPYSDIIVSVDGHRAGRIEVVHDAVCHALAEIVPLMMEKA